MWHGLEWSERFRVYCRSGCQAAIRDGRGSLLLQGWASHWHRVAHLVQCLWEHREGCVGNLRDHWSIACPVELSLRRHRTGNRDAAAHTFSSVANPRVQTPGRTRCAGVPRTGLKRAERRGCGARDHGPGVRLRQRATGADGVESRASGRLAAGDCHQRVRSGNQVGQVRGAGLRRRGAAVDGQGPPVQRLHSPEPILMQPQ